MIRPVRKNILLLSVISAVFLFGCARDKIDFAGHAVFTANGASFAYAAFGDGGKPRFHTIRCLKGFPDAATIEIIDVVPVSGEDLLVITRKHGLYLISSLGASCERIDKGIPPEVVYPFEKTNITKPIISHSVSRDSRRVAVLVPCNIYLSSDGGYTFSRLPLLGIQRFTELISVALHPVNERLVVIGTSSNGVYYSLDGGATARRIRTGVPGEPTRSPNFLEEIRSLCFGSDEDTFYAGLGNGCGVYRGSLSKGMMESIGQPELVTYPDGDFYRVTNLHYLPGSLLIGTNRKWRRILEVAAEHARPLNPYIREYFLTNGEIVSAHTGGEHLCFHRQYVPRRDFEPDRRALDRRALYISYSFTQKDNYDRLIRLLRHLRLNAVVVNLKDDYGTIRVPATDPAVIRVPDSVNPYVNVRGTIRRLQSDGVYVIARQVCFKDEKLYRFKDGRFAVKNPAGLPFRKGPEKWVDGFSEFVWDYNIAAAREIERVGADEIQFDYIRFPDVRGENDGRRFDFKREHQTMREALVSFLTKARESLRVPISIDLFGYNAIYQWGDWIGQDVTELSRCVDAISPMFYPSHYTGGYAASYGDRRIYYTIYLSSKRARELSGGVILRPYLQAFYYKDNADNYCVDYIGWELDAITNSRLRDYIFWNDLSEYTILIRGLRKHRGLGGGPVPSDIKESIPKKLPFSTMVERNEAEGPL